MAVLGVGVLLMFVALGLGIEIAVRGSGQPAWTGWFVLVVGLICGITVWLMSSLTVTVTDDRFIVGFGPARWPRRVIDLHDVTAVEVILLEPMQWGGWGYRWNPWAKATAAVIRKGPGIVLTMRDDRRFAVTVNDADTGGAAVRDALTSLPH